MEQEVRMQARDANQQGVVLLKAGNLEAAKKKFDRAVELDPMLPDSYKNYGDLYVAAKEYAEAKRYYKKALLIEKQGLFYFLYGNVCFLNDEPHEGLENYNLALSAGYDSDEMLFFMGMAYEHLNDDRMALRYFQKAIFKNPSRTDYKVKKMSVLLRLDMLDEAEKAAEELLLEEPELYDAYHIRTSLFIQRRELDKAEAFAKAASGRFPEDAELYYDYARVVALNQKFDEALVMIKAAKKLKYYESAKPQFMSLEAQVLAESGKIDDAIRCCEERIALEEEEFDAEDRFMLANLYFTKPDYEKALQVSGEIIEENQKDSYYFSALYYRPFCLKKLGKEEQAVHFYEEAVKLYRLATLKQPEALDAYLYRAMCLKDIEKYEEALDVLEFLDGLGSEIAEIHTIRADIYNLTGKRSLAKEEIEKACVIKPQLKAAFEGAAE